MTLSVALINLKPGTAKTTTAVWLAHALHELGEPVLFVDADPAASALEWSDLAGGFPFRIVGLPTRELHRRVAEIVRPGESVIIDTPQMEDHEAIVKSAMRYADELLLPVAPHGIEVNRMSPVINAIEDLDVVRPVAPRFSVVLNRINKSSSAPADYRQILTEQGYEVLQTMFPFVVRYSQSFAMEVSAAGTEAEELARELLKRSEAAR
ncbi:ParA family protein [Actinocorallia aurantiaca]|uniref:CobQ/CobB/MinD/ParA nucleotide binding domain-containing protein n=1 Tax=Actinocorallia aurantiaca TaxID=46204 RepID=A0ABN3UWS1_9ACTN